MKICTTCGTSKPLEEFYIRPDGYITPQCRRCAAAKSKAWAERKRAEIGEEAWKQRQAEAMRRHRQRHRDTGRARARAYDTAERILRERHRAEFDEIYREQRAKAGRDGTVNNAPDGTVNKRGTAR